jgi:hypothetical protein
MGGFGFFSNPILGPLESLRPGRLDIREIRGAHHRDEDLRLALHSNGGSNIFAAIEVSRDGPFSRAATMPKPPFLAGNAQRVFKLN